MRATSFDNWSTEKLPDYLAFFINSMKDMNLAVTEDGQILDRTEGYLLSKNHVRGMIRRSYLESQKQFSGKLLVKLIDKFLDGVVDVINDEEVKKSWKDDGRIYCSGKYL